MRQGYLIFHHNLMFSSIPTSHYKYIIENIYSKILEICEEGTPIALEFNGFTLKKINELAPAYTKKLKSLLKSKKCQLVGSSYTQTAFPLIPAKVNEKNLELGLNVYKEILNEIPKLCLLNEQIYSYSTIDLIKNAGYESFIFDYPNSFKEVDPKIGNKWAPSKNRGLNIIWSDSVLTQKFQRTVWGDLDFNDYFKFLKEKCHSQLVPFYCGDAEIFEYIPGSLNFSKGGIDFFNMKKLIEKIKKSGFEFVLPAKITNNQKDNLPEITIATSNFPIKTKKQNKYNVTRWAVTGRDSMKMNSQCFLLYKSIKNIPESHLWERLCYLWGSDFRTNTTDEKYLDFRNEMGKALPNVKMVEQIPIQNKTNEKYVTHEQGRYFEIETENIKLSLIKNKGLAINSLHFKKQQKFPCIGTIPQGNFENISYSADYYSMHTIIVTKEGHQITDLSAKIENLTVFKDERGLIITTEKPMDLKNCSIIKEFILNDSLTVNIKFYFYDLFPLSIRTGIITFLPEFLNEKHFFYSTYNGGNFPEEFKVENIEINQISPVNQLVSATSCLGDTEESIVVKSGNKKIEIKTDKVKCYSVPLLFHENIENKHFFRIFNSICEKDDVSNQFFKGYKEFTVKILGE